MVRQPRTPEAGFEVLQMRLSGKLPNANEKMLELLVGAPSLISVAVIKLHDQVNFGFFGLFELIVLKGYKSIMTGK